jgi:uncharacterized YccA/Bax inhibitor family protein
MFSGNPALQADQFRTEIGELSPSAARSNVMTMNGAIAKTGILVALLVVGAAVGAWICQPGAQIAPVMKYGILIGSLLTSLICGIVLYFSQKLAPVLAPVYALSEGVFLGVISTMYASVFHGIIPIAVLLTVGLLGVMLFAYSTGVLRATPAFAKGLMFATLAIFAVYMLTFVLQFCGVQVPMIHRSGPIGICFSIFVVVIATLNFILDFDLIENGAKMQLPKYMEWYAAYGLILTLIWLYLEVLRLVSYFAPGDD